MKRIVLLAMMSLFSLSLIAQNRLYLAPGYMGNVEFGVGFTTSREMNATISRAIRVHEGRNRYQCGICWSILFTISRNGLWEYFYLAEI